MSNNPYLTSKVKRILDVVVSFVGMIILGLMFPILAVAIKVDGPGPIFYRRKRLGINSRPFAMNKFRTMRVGSDILPAQLRTQTNDPRVTNVGRVLRHAHLDEFPQFINVLRGEMSVVGPRPEFPELTVAQEQHAPGFSARLTTKPGITGSSQIETERAPTTNAEAAKRINADMFYLEHASFYLDIKIVFLTLLRVIKLRQR